MSGSQPATRSEPREKPLRSGIRRKRIVLSCLTCKRRKVKCDRQAPVCLRCVEGGYPEQCRYDERLASTDDDVSAVRSPSPVLPSPIHDLHLGAPSTNHSRNDAPNQGLHTGNHVADFQARLMHISNPPGVLPVTPPASTNHTTVIGDDTSPVQGNSGRPLIQGASFNTQFHGMSHSINVISYFDGLRGFLKKTGSDHPVLGAHRWAVQTLATSRQLPSIPVEDPDEAIKRLLPHQTVCRSLMLAYFKHFEGMFRILHGPSFWRRFDAFWAGSIERISSFSAVLLAAISCARCLYVDNPLSFDGDSSSARTEAIQWVRAAESWHDQQSPKHTTVDVFQIKCLILLSKRINTIKTKRHYTLSQTLLANAISIGLHRSPSSLGDRASVYDKEMRRRLWSTISELDLAESMERGVPSLVSNLYSDIEPPANIREEDFDEATVSDPLAQQERIMTQSSFARYAHYLRPLQHSISSLANNPERHRELSTTELNTYHEQIFNRFFDLQSWPTSLNSPNYSDANFLGCVNLQLQLHKLLIMLHLPSAIGKTPNATTSHSRLVCSNSSKSVIGIYMRLAEQGFSQMCLPRTDLMRATLCLCLIESTSTGLGMCPLPASLAWPQPTNPSIEISTR
ncbi:MAG: hypothetical protein Q9201_006258 [Fulgogasparrea decipioides]